MLFLLSIIFSFSHSLFSLFLKQYISLYLHSFLSFKHFLLFFGFRITVFDVNFVESTGCYGFRANPWQTSSAYARQFLFLFFMLLYNLLLLLLLRLLDNKRGGNFGQKLHAFFFHSLALSYSLCQLSLLPFHSKPSLISLIMFFLEMLHGFLVKLPVASHHHLLEEDEVLDCQQLVHDGFVDFIRGHFTSSD